MYIYIGIKSFIILNIVEYIVYLLQKYSNLPALKVRLDQDSNILAVSRNSFSWLDMIFGKRPGTTEHTELTRPAKLIRSNTYRILRGVLCGMAVAE